MSEYAPISTRPAARIAAIALGFAVAGCQHMGPASSTSMVSVEAPPPGQDWRGVARAEDLARIDGLPALWRARLGTTRPTQITDPGTALPRAFLPPGDYLCRVHAVGAAARPAARVRGRRAGGNATQPFNCHVGVEGQLLSFTQQTGPRRPGGFLYSDSDQRMIFIGADARDRDRLPPPYGSDPTRDSVGVVERVGSLRYRLVLIPRTEGAPMDIIELTPAPRQADNPSA